MATEEKRSLVVADGTIDWVDHFPYLGSLITKMVEFMRRLKEELPILLRLLGLCNNLCLRIPNCLLILSDRYTGSACSKSCCRVVSAGHLFTGSSGT